MAVPQFAQPTQMGQTFASTPTVATAAVGQQQLNRNPAFAPPPGTPGYEEYYGQRMDPTSPVPMVIGNKMAPRTPFMSADGSYGAFAPGGTANTGGGKKIGDDYYEYSVDTDELRARAMGLPSKYATQEGTGSAPPVSEEARIAQIMAEQAAAGPRRQPSYLPGYEQYIADGERMIATGQGDPAANQANMTPERYAEIYGANMTRAG